MPDAEPPVQPASAKAVARVNAAPVAAWLRVVAALPEPLLRAIAGGAAWVLRVIVGFRRREARRNLARCFPAMTRAERRATLARHYREMSETALELFQLARFDAAELRARVQVHNVAAVHAELAAGRSVLLLTAHQGNWEWLTQRMVIEFDVPIIGAYKPLRSARLNRDLLGLRQRFGLHLYPAKGLLRQLLRAPRPHAAGLLADQMPHSSPSRVWIDFLGQRTAFYPGPGEMALRLGYSAFYFAMRRTQPGRYEADVQPIAMASEAVDAETFTRRYAACVEAQLRARPWDWTWGHRRWKIEPPV